MYQDLDDQKHRQLSAAIDQERLNFFLILNNWSHFQSDSVHLQNGKQVF